MGFLIGSAIGLFLIDSKHGGRKKQLIGASTLMGPPLVIGAILLAVHGPPMVTAYGIWIFSFGFQTAWGIVPWFFPGERERASHVDFHILRFPIQFVGWF